MYLASSIISAALPFLVLPVLTRYLNPEEFGSVGIFQSLLTVFSAIIGFSTAGAVIRKSYGSSQKELAVYIFNCICLMAVSVVLTICVLLSLWPHIEASIGLPISWVLLAILFSVGQYLFLLAIGQYQVNKRPFHYAIFQVGNSSLNIGLSLVFVVALGLGGAGRVYGFVVAAVVFGFLAITVLVKSGKIGARIDKPSLQAAMKFGVPLIPHELGTFMITWLAVIMINRQLDIHSAGIYLLAYQVAAVLGVITDAFNKAYVPWLFEHLIKESQRINRRIVKLTYGYFALLLCVSGLSFLVGPDLISLVFGSDYAPAAAIIGWLAIGQAFGGMYLMVTNYIFYSKRTGVLSSITLACGATNFILLYFFISAYGITGAAMAFAAARLLLFLLTWAAAQARVPMPWIRAMITA